MTTLLNALAPSLLELAGLVVTGLLGWLANTARQKLGLQVEAGLREALHGAVMTGLKLALERATDRDDMDRASVDDAVAYVKRSSPDAVRRLRASDDVLRSLAVSKLPEAAAEVRRARRVARE